MSLEQPLSTYRLTQYSHGAGCGCKIAPAVLDKILQKDASFNHSFPGLLVGNQERDDAAVFDLGDGTAVVSTTDFFMPIVDDAQDFGRIASVNAISDIYAMGAKPLVAIAILGWPIKTLPPELANEVIQGARKACAAAGIPLAGGHSIDSPEPIFGLAVTGQVKLDHLKRNGGARPGAYLYLTKGLGVGILSTSEKKGKLRLQDQSLARNSMVQLNKIGELFGQQDYIQAMTDVTGFGLLGHLTEMCTASKVSAKIDFSKVPLLDKEAIDYYLSEKCVPGGTNRNWDSYGHKIGPISERQKAILCDPQTSGGLMVAGDENSVEQFEALLEENDLSLDSIGRIVEGGEYLVEIVDSGASE